MSELHEPLLSVRGLKQHYPIKNTALLPKNQKVLRAVDGIDLDLYQGETLGLVGESGCGKSTAGRMIVGLERPTEGTIVYRGRDLVHMPARELSGIRTELQMIFQDAYSSLNPRKRIEEILTEPMLAHHLCERSGAHARAVELLEMVGLSEAALQRYPHEFSGGQRQRISIARALSLNPSLIVCDEPVSALDVSIQAQILNLLKEIQSSLGVSYLFIAHGLGAVRYISQRIAVMYLGKIVELGTAEQVFDRPQHPYAQMLIAAVPVADPEKRLWEQDLLEGEVPSPVDLPEGCRFAKRCPYAADRCYREEPALLDTTEPGHFAACWKI